MSEHVADALLIVSIHAFIRPVKHQWVLQSAITSASLPLNSSTFRLLNAFLIPTRSDQVLEAVNSALRPSVQRWIETCRQYCLLEPADKDFASNSLSHWQFHDLLFHASSRAGRNREPLGGTYRLRGLTPEEDGLHDSFQANPGAALPAVDLEKISLSDVSLTHALTSRATRYGREKLSITQLSEFLSRACRETIRSEDDPTWRRPYPSGGARYPLEIYFVPAACEGLEPALYQYNPRTHRIIVTAPFGDSVTRLLEDAATSTGDPTLVPPILFLFSARFRRTAWKYEGIAYHLILAEVGALMQTMYLVGEAMGLAVCALGSGNSDLFSSIIKIDYYLESTVGEMILGGR